MYLKILPQNIHMLGKEFLMVYLLEKRMYKIPMPQVVQVCGVAWSQVFFQVLERGCQIDCKHQ